MLKTRIIPTLLWKNLGLVKGVGFNSWRRIGSILPVLKVFNSRDVDELVLLDITASVENSFPDIDLIRDYSAECSVPFTVGGGINDLSQITSLLHAGADKVVINSAAYSSLDLIRKASQKFGAQCIVAGIDFRKEEDGSYRCWSHSGTVKTDKEPSEWAETLAAAGAGEILLTSIDRDGTMTGYDLDVIKLVSSSVNIPVIASGGAGNFQHMIDAVKSGASAVSASSIFQFTEFTPYGAKAAMQESGIAVRRNYSI